jgi:hypothetical protein
MSTARRLYLYGVSAVALTLLCMGAVNLLLLVLEQSPARHPRRRLDREALAALALLLVGSRSGSSTGGSSSAPFGAGPRPARPTGDPISAASTWR